MAKKSCGGSCCENGPRHTHGVTDGARSPEALWEGMELRAQLLSRKRTFFAEHLGSSVILCLKVQSVSPFVGGACFFLQNSSWSWDIESA